MPPILRSRVALFALMGAFLIPVFTSSLRGLTHLLSCQEKAESRFTLLVPESGDPLLTSASRGTRGEDPTLCGGLTLDLQAREAGPGRVAIIVPITNRTEFGWQGSVSLLLDSTRIPVEIGEIPAGRTVTDTVEVRIGTGTHEIDGSLLIGP